MTVPNQLTFGKEEHPGSPVCLSFSPCLRDALCIDPPSQPHSRVSPFLVYSLARPAVTEQHELGVLQKFIVSQFWRLDIRDEGVGRVGSF